MSNSELGLFLRTRRESVKPAEVGLPTGQRRRTPGLRRSELATLAGVSVEYLTRLEQGRDRHPSPSVLSAIADVLRLPANERVHLYRLTKGASGFTCMGDMQPNREVRPAVRSILDHLEPAAAIVVNRLTEILAATEGYRTLMESSGQLDHELPDLAGFVFDDPRSKTFFPDWDHVADQLVATLKQGPFRADPNVDALADRLTLTAGAAFTDRVGTVPGLPSISGITRMRHPEAGGLRMAYETLDLPGDDDQQLIVYLPADDATAAALDELRRSRSGGLRAVAG